VACAPAEAIPVIIPVAAIESSSRKATQAMIATPIANEMPISVPVIVSLQIRFRHLFGSTTAIDIGGSFWI
jgi:hypothetical protein